MVFSKLPKERYTGVHPVRRGLLSQLFDRSLPAPQIASYDDHSRGVPVPPSASVPVNDPLDHRRQHGIGKDLESESESEASDPENAVLLPKSLAYLKLAEIAKSSRVVQQRRRPLPPVAQQSHASPLAGGPGFTAPLVLPPPTVSKGDDCPAEGLPQSPGTIRRGIIEKELSHSWRHMLLHHRHLGRPPSRTVAPPKTPFSDVIEGISRAADDRREGCDPATAQDQMSTRKRAALARWAWWADEYHYRGW